MASLQLVNLAGNKILKAKKTASLFSGLAAALIARGCEKQKAGGQHYWLWRISDKFYIYACHREDHAYANKVFIDADLYDLNAVLSRLTGILSSPLGTTTNSKFEKFKIKRAHADGIKTEYEGWRFQFANLEAFEKFLDVCQAYDSGGIEAAALTANQFEQRATPRTGRTVVTEARVGQQDFRIRLLKYWKACALTGCSVQKILRASHIKPWSAASPDERLDLFNGLLLLPTLDALFDSGLITFSDSGEVIISSTIPKENYQALSLSEAMRIRKLNTAHIPYLSYHRQSIFKL